jgi:hypothetical protein
MTPREPKFSELAAGSIIFPFFGLIFGLMILAPKNTSPDSDWFGSAYIIQGSVSLAVAAAINLAFSFGSFRRREPKAKYTLLIAIPAAVYLFFFLALSGTAIWEKRRVEIMLKTRSRLIADAAYRESLVKSDTLSIYELRNYLFSKDVADKLSPEQIRHLWHKWKKIMGGSDTQTLIGSDNTPPDVLEDYYKLVIDEHQLTPPAHRLIYHETLLRHKNLPEGLLNEIRAFDYPPLNEKLKLRDR